MKLSIIIVNYNVRDFLEQCLESIKSAINGTDDIEVIVVDNNSTDGSTSYLKTFFPSVTFIENKENTGFAKANNQGIKVSKGEYILLLNPDTVIGEDLLRTVMFFMDEHPEAGAIGVKMIDGNGHFLVESKRAFPTPWVSFCKIFGLSKFAPTSKRWAKYSLPYLNEDTLHSVEVLAGACMCLRKEAIEKSGLLDESFFMYGEDIDLSYRIIQQGYKNYYLPERILHYKGESSKQDDKRYIKAFYGAMNIFYHKYYSDNNLLFTKAIQSAIGLKACLSGLAGASGLKNNKKKIKKHRILIFTNNNETEDIEKKINIKLNDIEKIRLWDLNKSKLMNALSRQHQPEGYTDIVFCYPDLRFEQILLFMDKMKNKNIMYHIYNRHTKKLI